MEREAPVSVWRQSYCPHPTDTSGQGRATLQPFGLVAHYSLILLSLYPSRCGCSRTSLDGRSLLPRTWNGSPAITKVLCTSGAQLPAPLQGFPPLLGPTSPCLGDSLRERQTLLAHMKCACVQLTLVLRAEPPHFPVTVPRDTMTEIHAGSSPPKSPVLIVSQLLAFDNLSKVLSESLMSFGWAIKQTLLL